jgi:GTP-binding protein
MRMSGLIAIVGRPNVGKSALFNRIVGKRIAIVHDLPGVTRDRVSAEAQWEGRPFTLVDTGGLAMAKHEDMIAQAAREQVSLAIEMACAIIFVVNVQEGIVPLDLDVAHMLRQSGKPILLAVNKVDTSKADDGVTEFTRLGFDLYPVSAIHERGVGALMQAAMSHVPAEPAATPESQASDQTPGQVSGQMSGQASGREPLKLAIVGRPNVGKSSIINALTKSKRVIVTPIAGTTRDSVDVPLDVEIDGVRQRYILIDTAGVRQERRIDDSIEFFSVKRTEDSIARCDIVVFVLDAQAGISAQDKKVAAKIIEERKACVVVINKWDLVQAEGIEKAQAVELDRRKNKDRSRDDKGFRHATLEEFGAWVQEQLFFLDYAPVLFTSAATGFHLDKLLEIIRYVSSQLRQTIPTALLNRTLRDAIEKRQPISAEGHLLKFFYATQVRQAPPTFILFVNRDELFSETYRKYLTREMRAAFGYEGCPILLVSKPRPKSVEPVRTRTEFKDGRRRDQPRHTGNRGQFKTRKKPGYSGRGSAGGRSGRGGDQGGGISRGKTGGHLSGKPSGNRGGGRGRKQA